MQNRRFSGGNLLRYTLVPVFLFTFLLCEPAMAQLEKMSADEVLKEANLLLTEGQVVDAIPYLENYLERAKDSEDARVLSMAQDVRFKLGTVYIQQKNLFAANTQLETYTQLRPAPKWNAAMKLLSTGLFEVGDFEACVRVTTNALSGLPADVRAKLEGDAAEAAEEEAKRIERKDIPYGYIENEYGELVKKPKGTEDVVDADPFAYTVADLLVLNMTLGNAYIELGSDELALVPFTYVIEHTDNSIHKGYAIMQVVNGLIEKKDFEELTQWIPKLYRTEARYDIRVNMALLNAAMALFEAKEYDSALPLYRMILPREELINYQSVRIWEMKLEAEMITPDQVPVEYRSQMDETLFGKKYSLVPVEEFWSEQERDDPDYNKPKELLELEELVEALRNLPPYEQEVLYRSAYLYDDVERPWEAVGFFDRVHQAAPESLIGERSFYELIRVLLDPLEQREEAEERGFAYLDANNAGMTPRQIAYLLTGFYQKHDLMPDIKNLLPYLEGFEPTSDMGIRKYDCELYYMQAVADLVMLEYKLALAAFQKVLDEFPQSHQQEGATYWHAATLMFLQEYEAALPELEAYVKVYPNGEWIAPALFQSGTCLFGLEQYTNAFDRFTVVIDTYPDAKVFPDACNLRGDIYGSWGELDLAVADYRQAIASAHTHAQDKYATFQMAATFELENKFDLIIQVVNDYMDRHGDDADIAEGIFWIGKTKVNQGLIDEAVQAYFDAIVQYGVDLEQGGVDSMIAELVNLARVKMTETQRDQLKSDLFSVISGSDSETLQLRIRAMIAQMNGTEIELGKQLIAELPDLGSAAPPVLSVIAKASFELADYSRAEEILDVFSEKFAESDFMRPAFRLRGVELFLAGDYDEALKLIADAQARYGTDYDAAWAQLMKGEICIKQARFDAARSNLTAVLNERNWRGVSYAEATYLLGQAEEAAGNPLKAHGWYQRVYVQYKGYDQGKWAADAYLGSARCLNQLGLTNDARNTWRAMLFDKYVNTLPQADQARQALGVEEALEISQMIAAGVKTNIAVTVEQKEGE